MFLCSSCLRSNNRNLDKNYLTYFISKQDDDPFKKLNVQEKAKIRACYQKLGFINGEVLCILKSITFGGNIKVVAYYFDNSKNQERRISNVSRMIISDVNANQSIKIQHNIKMPLNTFAKVCNDQYLVLKPYNDIQQGSYGITFFENPTTLLNINIIIDSNGRDVVGIKNSCDKFIVKEYLANIITEIR